MADPIPAEAANTVSALKRLADRFASSGVKLRTQLAGGVPGGLIGGVLGGGLGYLGGGALDWLSGEEKVEDKNRRRTGMLAGALAGGLGGAYMGQRHTVNKAWNELKAGVPGSLLGDYANRALRNVENAAPVDAQKWQQELSATDPEYNRLAMTVSPRPSGMLPQLRHSDVHGMPSKQLLPLVIAEQAKNYKHWGEVANDQLGHDPSRTGILNDLKNMGTSLARYVVEDPSGPGQSMNRAMKGQREATGQHAGLGLVPWALPVQATLPYYAIQHRMSQP